MQEVESRFAHFLQPIRDLTKNWEVDVASQLGEYLQELEEICISFDGGKTTMNFIEAALLIQGSVCIYSKKVEYLYSLVYQALDFISNRNREKLPGSVGNDGVDTDISRGAAAENEEFLFLNDIQESRANMDLNDNQQHKVVNIVPLTPMSLVPPEETEKKDNPLFSQKGEMLASRRDFRMNICTPHTTGTFALELAGLSPTQCLPARACEWGPGNSMGVLPAAVSTPMNLSAHNDPVLVLDFSGEGAGEALPLCGNGDGCGDDFSPDDVPRGPHNPSTPGAEERVANQMGFPQRKGYQLREREPAHDDPPQLKETLDPWRSLDPFRPSEEKSLRKGRPFAVPCGLKNFPGSKRKRRLPGKLQEFSAWFGAMEHGRVSIRRNRRKGPTFADLEDIYWKHVKERLVAQRKRQRRMVDPQLAEEALEEPDPLGNEREEEDCAGCPDGDGGGGAEDLLDQDQDPLLEAPEEAPGPEELPSTLSYEDLVRKNVELFMAHSEKYARETVLSRRVQDWEDMMEPQLEEQEARVPFDIHAYGDLLVSRMGQLGEWRPFASLVAGLPAFEVCRYMLASLQLANDYTVEVSQEPGLEESVDTMALRLLTQERAHDRFRTYTAPSLAQQ